MTKNKNSIISTGNTYRIFDTGVETHNLLPVQTYRVEFSMFEGFSLKKVDMLTVGDEKVYGSHTSRLDRISQAYSTMNRSLGVMLSGDKGMGKSLMVRMIADRFAQEHNLPIVMVEDANEGIAKFLDSLGECVVVFDEFEKRFGKEAQADLLGLFDGVSTTKRLYLVTANDITRLSDFMVNRPGRFHYHIRFNYPTPAQVREYLTEQAPSSSESEVEAVVTFSQQVDINYDHLRAVAFELELGGKFKEVIDDLNIKRVSLPQYNFVITFKNGTVVQDTATADLFGEKVRLEVSVPYLDEDGNADSFYNYIEFNPRKIHYVDGNMFVDGKDITFKFNNSETAKFEFDSIVIERTGTNSYSYNV